MKLKIVLTVLFCAISGIISGYLANPENGSYTCFVEAGFLFSISIAIFNIQDLKRKILFVIFITFLWPIFLIIFFEGIMFFYATLHILYSKIDDALPLITIILFTAFASLFVLIVFEVSHLKELPLIKHLKLSFAIGTINVIIYFLLQSPNNILWMLAVSEGLLGGYIAYLANLRSYEF